MNLQGAVDLGAVAAAREAQAKAAQVAAERAANPIANALIIDVTTAVFEQEVLARSMTVPVVEYDGRWILAKVDVDAEQQIAAAFQVQSIPAVFVVIGGQVAPMFQGAMPESQVRQVIDAVLLEAQKAGISDSVGQSQDVPGEAVQVPSDPRFDAAEDALEAGDWGAAANAYQTILAASPGDPIAKIGLLNVQLLQRTDGRELADDITNLTLETDSVLCAADATFLLGEFADAFALLIEHIKNSLGKDRDQARERLLELFAIAGPADPAVITGRSALTNALF